MLYKDNSYDVGEIAKVTGELEDNIIKSFSDGCYAISMLSDQSGVVYYLRKTTMGGLGIEEEKGYYVRDGKVFDSQGNRNKLLQDEKNDILEALGLEENCIYE